jgi:hypothetical protein
MKRATAVYLACNVIGILLFAWFVHRIEALAHAEQRHYRDGVDGITFMTTAVPVFVVCAVVNCAWAMKALVDGARRRGFEALKALIVVACAWTAVICSIRLLPL